MIGKSLANHYAAKKSSNKSNPFINNNSEKETNTFVQNPFKQTEQHAAA